MPLPLDYEKPDSQPIRRLSERTDNLLSWIVLAVAWAILGGFVVEVIRMMLNS